MSRWLSRFAVWTADDTTIVLWLLVLVGLVSVINMIIAQTVAAYLGIGAALGVFAGATLLGRKVRR